MNKTQEGLNLVNQEIEGLTGKFKKAINSTFLEMNNTVKKLSHNIEYTDFKDKMKIAFPIAVMASVITLAGYALINLINGLL